MSGPDAPGRRPGPSGAPRLGTIQAGAFPPVAQPGAGAARTPVAPAAEPASADEPSMEDILASIRRILSEDEVHNAPTPEPAPPSSQTQRLPDPAELPDELPPAEPAPGPDQDVLLLDPAMMVADPAASPRDPAGRSAAEVASTSPALSLDQGPILAPAAQAATTSAVAGLLRTLGSSRASAVHRNGPTIEDLVREEIRPILKEWLDTHLPPLVERLVQTEIERVIKAQG